MELINSKKGSIMKKIIITIIFMFLSISTIFAEGKPIFAYENFQELNADSNIKVGDLVLVSGKDSYATFGIISADNGNDAWRFFDLENGLYFKNLNFLLNNNTIIKSSMDSFFSFKNISFKGDNATRVYIEPASKNDKTSNTINDTGNIISGVGGALKIFGDAYTEGANYRDLGIYFHANQRGDIGYNQTGNFFINSKVSGLRYNNENQNLSPDIVFSFQDGKTIAGRFVHTDATGKKDMPYAFSTLYLGSNLIPSSKNSYAIKLFESKELNTKNNVAVEIAPKATLVTPSLILSNNNAEKIVEYFVNDKNELNQMISNINTETVNDNYSIKRVKEWNSSVQYLSSGESFEVEANLVILSGKEAFTIKNINGDVGTGFELTLVFMNSNTTISNEGNIKISQSITPKENSSLTLIKVNDLWIEKSRSVF